MARGLVVAGLVAFVWVALPARACAPAMPPGAFVSIAAEEALIVWDAERGIEHFIRRADFVTDADSFGFLVPTPSPPELSEVDGDVFARLRTHLEPPIEHRTSWMPMTCCMLPLMLSGAAGPPIEASAGAVQLDVDVEVLSTARVAGLDATVVRADDASALAAWLEERGYDNRPELVEWLTPYVDDGFVITAFQFSKSEPGSSEAIGSMAVRMSFETDQPFYPYREPSDQGEGGTRSLRVHVVSPQRAFGSLVGLRDWDAAVEFAAPIESDDLLGEASSGVGGDLWLTSFVEYRPSREDADLRFAVREGEEVRPAPIVVHGEQLIPLPIEPVVLIGGGIWWWRRRKKRAA